MSEVTISTVNNIITNY